MAPRRPGEQPRVFETQDPEFFEEFQRVRNGYARVEEAETQLNQGRQQVQSQLAQYRELQEMVTLDPVSFVHQHLLPEEAVEIGLGLLLQEGLWERVLPALQQIVANPAAAITTRAQLVADGYRRRDAAMQRVQDTRQANEHTGVLQGVVARLVPEGVTQAQGDQIFGALMADIGHYSKRYGVNNIRPEDVPAILAGRLRSLGIDPVQSAARLVPQNAAPGVARLAPSSVSTGAAAAPRNPPSDGSQFVQAAAVRAVAGAAAPQGAGAPAASQVVVPKGTKIKEAANILRQQNGLPTR